jgi:hypothetical protein
MKGDVVHKIRQFDWAGSVVFVASMTTFLVPVS